MSYEHRLYIGNKMTEIPYFNAPWFDMAERVLRGIPIVAEVFNPAAHDRLQGFDPMRCPLGSKEESRAAGFNVRRALAADWAWIARNSTGMVAGPDWMRSPGARSEVACHHALGLPVWEYDVFVANWNSRRLDELAIPSPPMQKIAPMEDEEPDDDGGFFCDCHG